MESQELNSVTLDAWIQAIKNIEGKNIKDDEKIRNIALKMFELQNLSDQIRCGGFTKASLYAKTHHGLSPKFFQTQWNGKPWEGSKTPKDDFYYAKIYAKVQSRSKLSPAYYENLIIDLNMFVKEMKKDLEISKNEIKDLDSIFKEQMKTIDSDLFLDSELDELSKTEMNLLELCEEPL